MTMVLLCSLLLSTTPTDITSDTLYKLLSFHSIIECPPFPNLFSTSALINKNKVKENKKATACNSRKAQ
uniref:Putative secreted protein n=1 Tax=Ixodes ricinus TaxID=34613 RepID=A0A6B0TZQ2_IXORI